jgi:rhodanese-related sulfurtransferase
MFGFTLRREEKTVSPAEAEDLALRGVALLVDVREEGEWAGGRIEGAVHAPLSRLESLAARLPADRPIVFYCLSGGRSARAIAVCRGLGLSHDTHMAGGISAWLAEGRPVVR